MLPTHIRSVSSRPASCRAPEAGATAGFTLIELVTILAIVGILVALAAGSMTGYAQNQRLNSSAREMATVFSYARGEAIRTGNVHLVYFLTDPNGIPLPNDAIVHDDGMIGEPGQNCVMDAGEATQSFDLETGVAFGDDLATAKVPTDTGPRALGASTFEDPAGNAASWVMFRPEGMPISFAADCSTGTTGTGGGAIYLNNGQRDVAVVLSPLGAPRTHSWDVASAAWTQ